MHAGCQGIAPIASYRLCPYQLRLPVGYRRPAFPHTPTPPCRSAFRLRNRTSSSSRSAATATALAVDPDTGGWLGPGWDPTGLGTLDFYAPHGESLAGALVATFILRSSEKNY